MTQPYRLILTAILLLLFVSVAMPSVQGQEPSQCFTRSVHYLPEYSSVSLSPTDEFRALGELSYEHNGIWYRLSLSDGIQTLASLLQLSPNEDMAINVGALPDEPNPRLRICEEPEDAPTPEPPDIQPGARCLQTELQPGQKLHLNTLPDDFLAVADHVTVYPLGASPMILGSTWEGVGNGSVISPGDSFDLSIPGLPPATPPLEAMTIYLGIEMLPSSVQVCVLQTAPTPTSLAGNRYTGCESFTATNFPSEGHPDNHWLYNQDVEDRFGSAIVHAVPPPSRFSFWFKGTGTVTFTLQSGGQGGPMLWVNHDWAKFNLSHAPVTDQTQDRFWYIGGHGGWDGAADVPFEVEICLDILLAQPLTPQPTFTPVPTHLAETRTAAVATATAAGPGTPLPTANHTTPTNTATPVPPDDCTDYSVSSPLAFDIPGGSQFWQVGYDSGTGSRLLYIDTGSAGGSQRVPRSPHTVGIADTFIFWPEVIETQSLPATLRICGPHTPVASPSEPTQTALASLTPARPTPLDTTQPNYNETQIAQLEDILDELRDDDPPPPTVTTGATPTQTNDGIFSEMATQQKQHDDFIETAMVIQTAETNPLLPPVYGTITMTPFPQEFAMATMETAFEGREPFHSIDQFTSVYSDTADVLLSSEGRQCDHLTIFNITIDDLFGQTIPLDLTPPFCDFVEATTTIRFYLRLFSVFLIGFLLYKYVEKMIHWMGF